MSDPEADTARDVRQLDLMNDRIEGFIHGEVGIARVVSDLDALQGQLSLVDEQWSEAFVGAWWELEIAYAVALEHAEPAPGPGDPGIQRALTELRGLISEHAQALGVGRFPEEDRVPSPAGWVPPADCRPGWNWVPPGGAVPVPQSMPTWLRVLYRTPVLDRRAHEAMWRRGGFLVLPPDHRWISEHA